MLFSHLVLFGFIYPSERARIPAWVMAELTRRLHRETASVPVADPSPVCRGPLLSRAQYLPDIDGRGYRDVRLTHESAMNERDIERWTEGIKVDGHAPREVRGGGRRAGRRRGPAGPGGHSRPRQCLARSCSDIFPSDSPARTDPVRGTGDPDPRGPPAPAGARPAAPPPLTSRGGAYSASGFGPFRIEASGFGEERAEVGARG